MKNIPISPDLERDLERSLSHIAGRVRRNVASDYAAISIQSGRRLYSLGLSHAEGRQPLSNVHECADSICANVIERGGVLMASDAKSDEVLRELKYVKDDGFTGYLGYPIRDSQGNCYGVMCVVTLDQRVWSEADMALVEAAACEAGSLYAVHTMQNELAGLYKTVADADRTLMTLANSITTLVSIHDEQGTVMFASSELRSAYDEVSLERAVQKVLISNWAHSDHITRADEGDVLRVKELFVTTPRGARVKLAAHIRRSAAETYYVYWKTGSSRLLN